MSQPELTVAMPAYNVASFIREALDSVLAQCEVDLELIVVDDASTDQTASIVSRIDDPRVRLLRNEERSGIAACHNRVVRESRAPFIAHVDADDKITKPYACRRLLDRIKASDDLGQVHCHHFRIDEDGLATREAFRAHRRYQLKTRTPGRDYRFALLAEGAVMNHLRLYRKKVLQEVGPFDESIHFGVDYDMALRILERYEIDVVPEVMYAVRKHERNTTALRFQALRFWLQRARITRRLEKRGQITYTLRSPYDRRRLLLGGFIQLVGLPRFFRRLGLQVYRVRVGAVRGMLRALDRAYRAFGLLMSWWPLPKGAPRKSAPSKIGYYLWHFPVGSQTFIRREIGALEDHGVPITIFADDHEAIDPPDETTREWRRKTTYLNELDTGARRAFRRSLLRQRPVTMASLFLYTLFHRYGYYKTAAEDLQVFDRAISLAGSLLDQGVTHLHSPWADRCAFVSMIASRMAGIPYSVEARAHDLHREQSRYGLAPRLSAARFVVTNSEYNRDHVLSIVGPRAAGRVHRVYEGIRLREFLGRQGRERRDPPCILTVARLIEEKGLVHLLYAADELRRRGRPFRMEVVGGSEIPKYANYEIGLRKLHTKLKLNGFVSFLGSMPFDQVMDRYLTADLFVLPCVVAEDGGRDITPNALLEAMAVGLPVVSTTIAAIPEIVTDRVDGLLVPPAHPAALADAMEELLGDADLRSSLGSRARAKVEATFDLDRNVHDTARLLTEQLSFAS